MSITNKLNQIKNAIYGKEVRGAIHDAIKECYDDATVNHDNANMEVKMARGTHNTLNDRLDEIQTQKASEKDLAAERSRIDNIVAVKESVDNLETADIRIDISGISHSSAGASVRFNQGSHTFNYEDSSLNIGYKKFLFFPFEKGSINPTYGTDNSDLVSIRTKLNSLVKFNDSIIIINKNPTLYRWKFYKFTNEGEYTKESTPWNTNNSTTFPLTDYKYRIQIATTDGSSILLEDALRNILILNSNDRIKNLEELDNDLSYYSKGSALEYDKTPMSYGCEKFRIFNFEIGGVITTNGLDDNSVNCCRTDFIKGPLDIKIKNVPNSNFRCRFVTYNSDKTVKANTVWSYDMYYSFTCSENEYVKIVCATKEEPIMNIEECLDNIKFFNSDEERLGNLTLPNYWKAHLKEKAEEIKMLLQDGANKVVFGITTDTHYNPSADFNRNLTADIIKYINDECNIDTFIHLGDIVSENAIKSHCLGYHLHVTKEFQRVAPIYLPIKGNHDDNHYSTYQAAISNSDMFSTTFRTLKEVVHGGNGTYYYHDKPFEKVRFVMLNSSDFHYKKHPTEDKLAEIQLAYGYEQIKWLTEVALDVPEDYKIILCSHAGVTDTQVSIDYPLTSPQTKPRQATLMQNIIRCYNGRLSLNTEMSLPDSATPEYFSGAINVDFSKAKGEIIGMLSGHEHIDDVQCIDTTNVKNIFFLNNSGNFSSDILNSKYQPSKELGKFTEEIYDIVIVDKSSRQYNIIRIGAGQNRIIKFND